MLELMLIRCGLLPCRWGERLSRLETMFKSYWKSINPDFQTEHDYGPEEPGSSNLALGAAQMCHRHDCVAFTLEMPFKVRCVAGLYMKLCVSDVGSGIVV